jgi:hypothetical protein
MTWAHNDPGGLASDDYALFLKVYGGEVVKEYNLTSQVHNKLRSRTIQNGKSATFPTITKEEAKVFTPGNDLFGSGGYESDMTHSEKIVAINKMLIATSFVDEVEEMMAHYDIRGPYAEQMGAALATAHDRWSIAAMLSDATAGTASATAAGSFTATQIKAGIIDAAQKMDAAGVPKKGRYVLLTPNSFYLLMQDTDVISSDYNTTGDVGHLPVLYYMGLEIMNCPLFDEFDNNATIGTSPLGDIGLGRGGAYTTTAGDNCEGLAFQADAAATVVLKGITAQVDWIPERQGNLLVAKQAIGVDVLRPEGIVKLLGA